MKMKILAVATAAVLANTANAGGMSLQLSTTLGKISGDPAPVGTEYKKVAPAVGVQYSTSMLDNKVINRYTVGVQESITGKTTPYLQATSEFKVAKVGNYDIGVGLGTQIAKQYAPGNEVSKTKAVIMPVASVTRDNVSVQLSATPSTKVDGFKVPGRVMLSVNIGLDSFFGAAKSTSAAAEVFDMPVSTSKAPADMSGAYEKLPQGTATAGEIYAPINATPEDNEVYSPLKNIDTDADVYKPISFRSTTRSSSVAMR